MEDIGRRALSEAAFRILDVPIMTNTIRGFFVENLVYAALAPDWQINPVWSRCDLRHVDGWQIEVKQSAARQVWDHPAKDRGVPSPTFAIKQSDRAWEGKLVESDERADLYVFAWHGEADWRVADQRRVEQWCFWVLPNGVLPDAKSISLPRLQDFGSPIRFEGLRGAVNQCVRRLRADCGAGALGPWLGLQPPAKTQPRPLTHPSEAYKGSSCAAAAAGGAPTRSTR